MAERKKADDLKASRIQQAVEAEEKVRKQLKEEAWQKECVEKDKERQRQEEIQQLRNQQDTVKKTIEDDERHRRWQKTLTASAAVKTEPTEDVKAEAHSPAQDLPIEVDIAEVDEAALKQRKARKLRLLQKKDRYDTVKFMHDNLDMLKGEDTALMQAYAADQGMEKRAVEFEAVRDSMKPNSEYQ